MQIWEKELNVCKELLLLLWIQGVRVDVEVLEIGHQLLVVVLERGNVKQVIAATLGACCSTSSLVAVNVGLLIPFTQEFLHRLPCSFDSSVFETKIFADELDQTTHLGPVLEVNVVDLDLVYCVRLSFVRIRIVDETLLLGSGSAYFRRVFA